MTSGWWLTFLHTSLSLSPLPRVVVSARPIVDSPDSIRSPIHSLHLKAGTNLTYYAGIMGQIYVAAQQYLISSFPYQQLVISAILMKKHIISLQVCALVSIPAWLSTGYPWHGCVHCGF